MARRDSPRAGRRRGVLRHYRRPLWRDRLFWIVAIPSVLATGLFAGIVLLASGVPEEPLGWLRPILLVVVVLLLSFRLLGAGVTTSRRFHDGLGEGSAARPGDLESKGRAAGAAVGRALRATRTTEPGPTPPATSGTDAAPGPPEEPAPRPAPTAEGSAETAATTDTVDRAARVAGAMLGRRLAERRRPPD